MEAVRGGCVSINISVLGVSWWDPWVWGLIQGELIFVCYVLTTSQTWASRGKIKSNKVKFNLVTRLFHRTKQDLMSVVCDGNWVWLYIYMLQYIYRTLHVDVKNIDNTYSTYTVYMALYIDIKGTFYLQGLQCSTNWL